MSKVIHVNEIKLSGDDRWTKQFNKCSDLWAEANDESRTKEEREQSSKLWFEERQRLELNIY